MNDKERLEEIKVAVNNYDETFRASLYGYALDEKALIDDYKWLIERVQELEDIIYQDKRQDVLEGLYEQNKRYREAIERAIGEFNYDEHQKGMSILLKALECEADGS